MHLGPRPPATGTQLTPGPQPTERLYTGQVWDWNANVHHYVARVYVPELARFTSTDPVREYANPYAYVKWAPTALIDPTGMFSGQIVPCLSWGELMRRGFEELRERLQPGNGGRTGPYGEGWTGVRRTEFSPTAADVENGTAVRVGDRILWSGKGAFGGGDFDPFDFLPGGGTTKLATSGPVHSAVSHVTSKAEALIAETLAGKGNITSKIKVAAGELLEAGGKFLGPGYKQMGKPDSGVFRSADQQRGFRIDASSITGKHDPYVPHGHLEVFAPGATKPIVSNHVPFFEE